MDDEYINEERSLVLRVLDELDIYSIIPALFYTKGGFGPLVGSNHPSILLKGSF